MPSVPAMKPVSLSVVIPGAAVPQGSTRAFVVGNRAVVVGDNKPKLREWRALAVMILCAEREKQGYSEPWRGPVALSVTEYRLRPKSIRRVFPTVKPDSDKILRAVCDSLEAAQVLVSDAQIVSAYVRKRYGREARVEIDVREMGEDETYL